MVSKGSELCSHEVGRVDQANLKLVPSSLLYSHVCDGCLHDHMFDSSYMASHGYRQGGVVRRFEIPSCGSSHTFSAALEQLECVVPMEAGDMIIFREDVWHKTQAGPA
jgi:ectoine hydroxylase-related dioxygenase (phytanoyl-CoA dioxygenase family)